MKQLEELVLQALETETGGIQIYTTALECVVNDELREEWEKYLEQTQTHESVVRELCEKLGFDPETQTPGRKVVGSIGKSLVAAMKSALASGAPKKSVEIVACECVMLAETKDHANWELISQCAESAKGEQARALAEACGKVEDEEDEHLYHTKGWCRELWIQSLGMPAVLPPPEEEKDVKTAIGAARAQQAREDML